jgi:1-acyl-sn-glycerol-3-phosphate acyltransferase
MGLFARTLLRTFGWKSLFSAPKPEGNFVLIVAPHTSWWDFVVGRFALSAMNLHGRFIIKKEMFKFPFGIFLKLFGGYPVDRMNGSNVVKPIIELFSRKKNYCIIITPEGTRKRTEHWKKGYYFIAHSVKVPIYCGYVDYQEKLCNIGLIVHPSGNYDADFEIIKEFYKGRKGKFPEEFNL